MSFGDLFFFFFIFFVFSLIWIWQTVPQFHTLHSALVIRNSITAIASWTKLWFICTAVDDNVRTGQNINDETTKTTKFVMKTLFQLLLRFAFIWSISVGHSFRIKIKWYSVLWCPFMNRFDIRTSSSLLRFHLNALSFHMQVIHIFARNDSVLH